jgi:hypothetical protein
MVTDEQIRRLFMLVKKENTVATAAAKTGMTPKTAAKYSKGRQLPSQMKQPHDWRTRQDSFIDEWPKIVEMLNVNSGLESKTIFEYFQRQEPGKLQDSQLRTLQRRIKHWRATEGPAKEVFFPQIHYPGQLGASDFTHMANLGVTIGDVIFRHMVYHFVLTYSNWEAISICYSESFGSFSAGLQNALWELGGVPWRHRTDRMSLAVNKDGNPEKFTAKYQALTRHYNLEPERINAASGNENGDVEQRHNRFKKAVDQELMLRGSRDFNNIEAYEKFLKDLLLRLNAGRHERLAEELKVIRPLPQRRFNDCASLEASVGPNSTISVDKSVYSVHSRLIGERVQIKLFADNLEVWYAQRFIERIPRVEDRGSHKINYRHIVDWLARKPGAFANYRYKSDMFPSSYFKMAYDELKSQTPLRADKEYIGILKIAAQVSEVATQNALQWLLKRQGAISASVVEQYVLSQDSATPVADIFIGQVNLIDYDSLLEGAIEEAVHG